MFKVIMVPTDGSDLERPAIALAVRLAKRFDAELRLVRADLIALATSGAGGVSRLLFGGVADQITRQSATSLLVFHPEQVAAPRAYAAGHDTKNHLPV
jgi:nucleotide-binding universal stress UspA family protein